MALVGVLQSNFFFIISVTDVIKKWPEMTMNLEQKFETSSRMNFNVM